MSHTPGPWHVGDDSRGLTPIDALTIRTPDGDVVAWLGFNSPAFRNRTENARLIAEAPNMLAALKRCEGHLKELVAYEIVAGYAAKDQQKALADVQAILKRLESAP